MLALVVCVFVALLSPVGSFRISSNSAIKNNKSFKLRSLGGDSELKGEIMEMRAGLIKKALTLHSVSTKGIFEKKELADLLHSKEVEFRKSSDATFNSKSFSVPLVEIPLKDNSDKNVKKYVGVDLNVNGKVVRFMIDTAASMNLIKPDVANMLGLQAQASNQFTTGLGGGGTIGSKMVNLVGASTTSNIAIPAQQCAVLDNAAVLPFSAAGLLGLGFLRTLPGLAEFDFKNMVFTAGLPGLDSSSRSPLSRLKLEQRGKITLRDIYTGLVTCEIDLNGSGVIVQAMVDIGSTYTILNSRAVTSVLNSELSRLPDSPTICAGIDGRPMKMKSAQIESIEFPTSDGMNVKQPVPRALSLYAADIAGMQALGLNATPSCILGMDVLGAFDKLTLDLQGRCMFLE